MHDSECKSFEQAFDMEADCCEPTVSEEGVSIEEGLAVEFNGQDSLPEDTESFDTLSHVQVHMAHLVIEAGRPAAEILGALRGGLCPLCLSSRLLSGEAPPLRRDGSEIHVCEFCENGIGTREAMVECLDCEGAAHKACVLEQLHWFS